jgi:hypothetical protein
MKLKGKTKTEYNNSQVEYLWYPGTPLDSMCVYNNYMNQKYKYHYIFENTEGIRSLLNGDSEYVIHSDEVFKLYLNSGGLYLMDNHHYIFECFNCDLYTSECGLNYELINVHIDDRDYWGGYSIEQVVKFFDSFAVDSEYIIQKIVLACKLMK